MRTILRVGTTVGVVAFVTLYALQATIALAVVPGILFAGLFAGLGTAKWLTRAWYGRQAAAGLRAGAIAVGLAAGGVLLAALTQGPQTTTSLAQRSHLSRLDMGPVIHMLAAVGWIGIDIVAVVAATVAGLVLCVVVTVIVAWSKNRRAIEVVNQAKLAAQTSLQGSSARVSGIYGVPAEASTPPTPAYSAAESFTAGVAVAPSPQAPSPQSWTPLAASPLPPLDPVPAPLPSTASHQSQKRRPVNSQLTQAMREALATWAGDIGAGAGGK